MKLREGNVFSCVGLSFCRRGFHVNITHESLDLTTQDPIRLFQPGPHCTGTTVPPAQGSPALVLPPAPRHVQTYSF